jgi:hypothetical protein
MGGGSESYLYCAGKLCYCCYGQQYVAVMMEKEVALGERGKAKWGAAVSFI